MANVAAADAPAPTATPVDLPTLAPSAPLNPYAKAAIDIITSVVHARMAGNENSANGRVTYFKRFEMQVRTDSNRYRTIHLHQGTAINPMGESIRVGQRVDVGGVDQSDGSLAANSIDIQQ
ncbi:MAG: hypothetical protein IAI50_11295 [Candidatus Eremiobacteraeota bacterium]|nr:hypothetical protein [Candidatus Eremiobacteraeota bacterium]